MAERLACTRWTVVRPATGPPHLSRQHGLAAAGIALTVVACQPKHPPPPQALLYEGLPVAGSLADAKRAGFNACVSYTTDLHCRRFGVMIAGQGPYDAAVDLVGSDGSGGFHHLTVWSSKDPQDVFAIPEALKAQGWRECFLGTAKGGDQAIYTRAGSPVFMAMDLSYWGTRRLRVLPGWNKTERRC